MFFDAKDKLLDRKKKVELMLSDSAVLSDLKKYQELTKEYAYLEEITATFEIYEKTLAEIKSHAELLETSNPEPDFRDLVEAEQEKLENQKSMLEIKISELLLPKDKNDERNTIVEIRAGTGGEEAALFAAQLFRMYSKYAEKQGWKLETMDTNPTDLGGIKEIIFSIDGNSVYRKFRYESGVHRVQRVPITESSGRIHTSAVTVAVLPEAEPIEVEIDPKDIRVDVFRSSGPGGQSVNTMDSAVRITHFPTKIIVQCQDEKSQLRNKQKAMRVLRARLLERIETEKNKERAQARKEQVSTGDRSAKIRTYNFRDNRITDHRIGLTIYDLENVLEGNMDVLIGELIKHDYNQTMQEIYSN